MESVERIKHVLLTLYPMRKTVGQKAMFREWLVKELKHDGYRVREERYGKTNGSVNVLNLLEGEEAVVESPDHAFEPFVVHYAETFIIPAGVGRYTIAPCGRAAGKACVTIKAYVRC